ncbi:hypothetical protein B0T17DRAFT_168085 [Bombardia bombarda]|uniref:NWD NACHT-NTPase N-terminal domain-containing protein n=1 Tax=Bombardia bombarda TaxID=252184 RepID=A0AA40C885_9PEZI|nr:hypothetical protein B0T17DRAFT_168085 [Bombardia bombarda]
MANNFMKDVASASPALSIAWTGINVLLQPLLSLPKEAATRAECLELISSIIAKTGMREELYHRRYESSKTSLDDSAAKFVRSHVEYKSALKELYVCVLRLQATFVMYLSHGTPAQIARDMMSWNKWDSLKEEIRTKDSEFDKVQEVFKDMEYQV